MEQIQNKCFWHIRIFHSGQPRWEIGKTYDIGIKKNFYSSFCDSFSPKGIDTDPIDHETEVLFSGKITVEKIVDPYHPV